MGDIVIFAVFYVVVGGFIIAVYAGPRRLKQTDYSVMAAAMLFRLGLTWYYYHYTLSHSADARSYFGYATRNDVSLAGLLDVGTVFTRNFTALLYPLAKPFDNQYLMLYLPYSLMAFIGSLLVFDVLREYLTGRKQQRELYVIAFFLPNLVFWTSNLGKDSVAFFGLSLMIFGVLKARRLPARIASLGIGGVALFAVRPHVMLLFAGAFAFTYFLQRGAFSMRKGLVFAVALAGFLVVFEPAMDYVGIRVEIDQEAGAEQVVGDYFEAGVQRMEYAAGKLNTGGAAVEREATNPLYAPLYFLQFLLGPFVWQARKPIQFISALENIIYQIMLIYLVVRWKHLWRSPFLPFKASWVLYILMTSTILGMAYTNFGLTVRQKCMVLPALILLFAAARAQALAGKKGGRKGTRSGSGTRPPVQESQLQTTVSSSGETVYRNPAVGP